MMLVVLVASAVLQCDKRARLAACAKPQFVQSAKLLANLLPVQWKDEHKHLPFDCPPEDEELRSRGMFVWYHVVLHHLLY